MSDRLAINGGAPVRDTMLPYGHHWVDEADIQAVEEVLRSEWLTTGPMVSSFEKAFAQEVGAEHAVAVSSGTAALQAAMYALEIESGDEVIIPAITFVATANCVVYQGGIPVFVDIDSETLLIDPGQVEAKITSRTKAIIAMDYGGHPCDYEGLRLIADRHHIPLVADACHSLGAKHKGRPVGSLAGLNIFSFHPVKAFTTGEGGMVATNNEALAQRMRVFCNHGITTDHRQRAAQVSFFYEMEDLGYNYRLGDLPCALGLSQMRKLPNFIRRRGQIAAIYDGTFDQESAVRKLAVRGDVSHAYHLYAVQLDLSRFKVRRSQIFTALRAENIGVNVHYMPVYKHPYYQRLGYAREHCANAEAAYKRLISLPIFFGMTDQDVDDVLKAVIKVTTYFHV